MVSIGAIIDFVKNITYFIFVISYNVGQLLINVVGYTVHMINIFYKCVSTIFSIIGEDFLIFIVDLLNTLKYILHTLLVTFENVFQAIASTFDNFKFLFVFVYGTVTSTFVGIVNGIGRIFLGIGQFFQWMKHVLLLLGSGMWFAITFIPLLIVYATTMTTYYFGRLLNEIYNMLKQFGLSILLSLKGFYEFVTDVPFESLAGLITTMCIVYILMRFHIVVYRLILNNLQVIRNNIRSYVKAIKDKLQFKRNNRIDPIDVDYDATVRLCTICHERDRCVLFLPCKHVTLCTECNERLTSYDNKCPLCRTLVKKRMKIYV